MSIVGDSDITKKGSVPLFLLMCVYIYIYSLDPCIGFPNYYIEFYRKI